MPRPLAALVPVLALVVWAGAARAAPPATYRYDPQAEVRGVRLLDLDGDGRRDVVALLRHDDGREEVLVLRTPAHPVPVRLFPADHVARIPCDGPRAQAGAVAVGRFGPGGAGRVRFLGPAGVEDFDATGHPRPRTPRDATGCLLARSPGHALVFWDAVADLDGDGVDETWFPSAEGDGAMRVFAGTPAGDRVLSLGATNRGAWGAAVGLARHAYVPNLFPVDLDGDGHHELVALRDGALVAWDPSRPADAHGVLQPSWSLTLPFLQADPSLGPEDLRTPRLQLEDVDGDGITDLLVTLITGVRSKLASIRTIFFHYPGPFRDPRTGKLVAPRARIDTQSIVLHPTFVDVDGDGAKDYVGDAIRGTLFDLIARMMGKNPDVTLVGFRFDKKTGTFAAVPSFTVKRVYSAKEALDNRFGCSLWLNGDFDGDGVHDLLDLGDLGGAEISRGKRAPDGRLTFEEPLLPRVPVADGLKADARIGDLDGDGRSDAVLWGDKALYFVLSGGVGR
jgi:hypothetical protein